MVAEVICNGLYSNLGHRLTPTNYRPIVMKALCFFGIIFGGLAVVLFGLDLAIKMPFGRPSWILNVGFIVSGLILIYTGWMTQKGLR